MTALDTTARRSLVVANLICLAPMVTWAAGLPAADLIIPHMPPVALTPCRALLAAAVLLPIWWLMEGGKVVLGANWAKGAWVGFVTLGLASFFVIIALQYNDPVTVAIVSAMTSWIGTTRAASSIVLPAPIAISAKNRRMNALRRSGLG